MIKYFKKSMNKKFVHTFPGNILNIFLGIITIVLTSCEHDPSSLGSNLLPESITYNYDTAFVFKANVYQDEPVITTNLSIYSFGIIDDEYFGLFKSEFAGQFLPSKYYSTDTTISTFDVDSVIIYVAIDSIYGSHNDGLTFKVYELNQEIGEDDYYSDENLSDFYSETDLISENVKFNKDTLIRIKLNTDFANSLISENYQDTVYKNKTNFTEKFKGIAIVPELSNPPGELLKIDLSSNNTEMLMYHNDSLTFSYLFRTGDRFASYSNDFSSSVANNFLVNSESENDTIIFLQGLNGLSSKINFEGLDSWIDSDSAYSVINAELFIPVYEDPNYDLFYPPNNLYLYYENDEDTSQILVKDYYDYVYNRGVFDGKYDSENKYYRFIIPKHVMQLFNRDIENHEMFLNMTNKTFYAHRVILKTGDNIKLKVTYTKH